MPESIAAGITSLIWRCSSYRRKARQYQCRMKRNLHVAERIRIVAIFMRPDEATIERSQPGAQAPTCIEEAAIESERKRAITGAGSYYFDKRSVVSIRRPEKYRPEREATRSAFTMPAPYQKSDRVAPATWLKRARREP